MRQTRSRAMHTVEIGVRRRFLETLFFMQSRVSVLKLRRGLPFHSRRLTSGFAKTVRPDILRPKTGQFSNIFML